jgi:hypothetical protein
MIHEHSWKSGTKWKTSLFCCLSVTGRAKESLSEHVFSSYKEVTYWNVFAYRYLGLHGAWPREPEVVGTLTFLIDEAS